MRSADGPPLADKTRRRAAAAAALLLALPAAPAQAAKTDVVVLKNGSHITCEVEQLQRGRLQIKTDDMGTIQIEWDKVASVTASALFDVDDQDGKLYLGSLAPAPEAGRLLISRLGQEETVDLLKIVRIRRLSTTFWKRLDGSLDVGASYTSASDLFKLDVAGTLSVDRPGHEVTIDASSTFTSQPEVEDTRRNTLSLAYAHRFENRWLALVQGQVEQNRELGFDLRTSASAGGGRYLLRRQRTRLLTALGLSLNRERPTEGESTTNVEAMAVVSFDRFSYDFPKVDVSVALVGFASLSDGGRYRLELDAKLKRELVRDFYVTLRGYESFDNRPPTEGAPNSDYGLTFALGWSF